MRVRTSRHKQRAFCMPRSRFVCTCLAQVSCHHHEACSCAANGRDSISHGPGRQPSEETVRAAAGWLEPSGSGRHARPSSTSARLRNLQWHGSRGRATKRLLRRRKRAARRRIAAHRRRPRQQKSTKPPRLSPKRPRNRLSTAVLSASQGLNPPKELSCSRGAGVALVFVLHFKLRMTHTRADTHTHSRARTHTHIHTPHTTQTQTQTQAKKTLTHTWQACFPQRVHWLVAEIGRDLPQLPMQREGLGRRKGPYCRQPRDTGCSRQRSSSTRCTRSAIIVRGELAGHHTRSAICVCGELADRQTHSAVVTRGELTGCRTDSAVVACGELARGRMPSA